MDISKIDLLQIREKKPGKMKRLFFGLGKLAVYIFIILGILVSTFSYQIIFSDEAAPSLGKFGFLGQLKHLSKNSEKLLRGERDDQINILLLGMGGLGHDGPYLTDTIILTSIRPSDNKVAMLSIPRDLAIPIPGEGWRKINHINSFGELKEKGSGGSFTSQVISDLFEIPRPYYIRIDFEGFKKLIDDLGGLKIYVERSFIDENYPTDDYKVQTISFQKGWQTMDGDTALKFVRSRHGNNGEGSDFARAERQQKVIAALKNKMLSFSTLINPKNIISILNAFSENVSTDLEIWEMIKLAQMVKNIDTSQIIHQVLDDSPGGYLKPAHYDGAYVLDPASGNFDEIRELIKNIFEQKVEKEKEIATIDVFNGTEQNGLAGNTADEIKKEGHRINKIANAPTQDYKKTVIYDLSDGQKPETLKYLKEKLDGTVITSKPSWLVDKYIEENYNYQADFIIILGQNNIPQS